MPTLQATTLAGGRVRMMDREDLHCTLAGVRAGDAAATDRLVRAFMPAVRRQARQRSGPRITLDELTQEGVVILIRAARASRAGMEESFPRFVEIKLWCGLLEAWRRQSRMIQTPRRMQRWPLLPRDEQASDDEHPADAIDREDRRGRLAAAVRLLPEDRRDLVRRRYGLDGRSPESLDELAVASGLNAVAVRQRLQRIRNRLGKTIGPGINDGRDNGDG